MNKESVADFYKDDVVNHDGFLWKELNNQTKDKLQKQLKEKGKQIVMTQPAMAKDLINTIDFKEDEKVLDPCRGDGAFYDNLPWYVERDWCEVNDGRDFMDYTSKVNTIISNPPFVPRKLFWNFHLKAMDIATDRIYWLVNASCINVFTPNRMFLMHNLSWYIQKIQIVQDKRWFGRYMLIKFGRENKGFVDYIPTKY